MKITRALALLLGTLSFLCTSSTAASAPTASSKQPRLDVVRGRTLPPLRDWTGMQSIHATEKGRVYLLRSGTLEVYPLDGADKLGEPTKLKSSGADSPASVRVAAMGEPEEWLFLGSNLRWVVDGKEVPLGPLNQVPLSVTLAGGKPVALLSAIQFRRDKVEIPSELPSLARWDGDEWQPLVVESIADPDPSSMKALNARDSVLASDSKGELWRAQIYEPRVSHYSASGKLRLEWTTEKGKTVQASDAQVDRTRRELERVSRGMGGRADAPVARKSFEVNTAQPLQRALTVARDGTVYLLIRDPEKQQSSRLRRWDPLRRVLDEVALPIDIPGRATMALGTEGLHIAHFNAADGRYFIPQETLDAARWRAVRDVEIDGIEAPADEP